MSPPTPRQQRRIARTRELLDIATRIVVEEGVDALTMAHLAAEASAGVGALYRYFPSKDDILAAVQIRALAHYTELLYATIDETEGVLAKVLACFLAWPRFAREQPEAWVLVEQSLSDARTQLHDTQAARVNQALQPAVRCAVQALGDAVVAGLLDPGDDAQRALVAWSAIHGIGHMAKRDRLVPETHHADALRRELLDTLLRGWGAPTAAVEAAWSAATEGARGARTRRAAGPA